MPNKIERRVRAIAFLLVCAHAVDAIAAEVVVPVKTIDAHGVVLAGIRFTYQGVETPPTTGAGLTELRIVLGPGRSLHPGTALELDLPQGVAATWFLIDDTVHVPGPGQPPAEVVLFLRSDMRRLAAEVRDANPPGPSEEDQRQVVLEVAAGYGLSEDDLEAAIAAFRRTAEDPLDEGAALFLAGELAEAEPFFRSALERAERERQDAEGEVVAAATYLGRTLHELGRSADAAEAFRKALAGSPDDPGVMAWLASTLIDVASWREAEDVSRRALDLAEARWGPDHPEVSVQLNNLAEALKAADRLTEAEPLLRRAVAIDEASLGPDHPEVAIRLNNLAQLLAATGRFTEAEPLLRRSLALNEASVGPDHPDVAYGLNNLGLLLLDTDRPAEAEPLLRRALEINETRLGPRHPRLATSLNNLAQLLHETHRLAEAEPLMRRALAIDEASRGPGHPTLATDLDNLARLLQDTGRLAEAEPLMRRALAIHEASLGPLHPAVATDLNNLAAMLQDAGRLAEAVPLMRRSLAIDEASFGPDHPRVAAALGNLAWILQDAGRLSEAEPLLLRALEIVRSTLPRDDRWIAMLRADLDALRERRAAQPDATGGPARAAAPR